MSEPIDRDKPLDSGVDIFNIEPRSTLARAADHGDGGSAAVSGLKAAASGGASKVGPVHFATLAALIAGAWIGWPYVSDASAPTGHLASSSQVLIPSVQVLPAPERLASAATPMPPAVHAAGISAHALETMTKAAPETTPAPTPTSMPGQLTAREAELLDMVTELRNQLAAAETQAAARMPSPAQSTAATVAIPRRPRRDLPDVSSLRAAAVVSVAPERGAVYQTLRDYTLNTVYRDQAWIQSADRTYVVGAGDMVGDMRIVRVDPRTRQVVTSRGVIR